MNNIETMELDNGEDSTQGNQEKSEPTDTPCLDKRKEDLKAEAEVETGLGEDHTGKKQKEGETTSASTLEDKKGEDHTEENPKEAETTSAPTLKDKKDESKTESFGSSQHTNTGAEGGVDSTHQEELETTDEPCLDTEKEDLKAEADIRAEQMEDHTEENLKETKTTSASTLKDRRQGAGDGETSQATTRRRQPQSQKKDEQKKDIENIGPKTMETTGFTVTECGSQSGTLTGLIIILGLTFGIYLAFTFKNHQSDSPIERNDVSIEFSRQMDKVENQFSKQEPEFWRRTRIHLQRHLQTAEPTEPVSLILTAGLRAEKTLDCLARGLASAFSSAFSSAFNSSFLHIDGASKANQDSDQVKLDIDSKLQRAFEGGSSAAVIHRFEELPPGSTLIFYRYCDHENAAFKETFLIFTVLLEEEEEITANIRLSALEEMVDDYLKKKFLSDSSPVSYDRMDLDKYGGLWSRISHLILPVAADERIEHAGCQGT